MKTVIDLARRANWLPHLTTKEADRIAASLKLYGYGLYMSARTVEPGPVILQNGVRLDMDTVVHVALVPPTGACAFNRFSLGTGEPSANTIVSVRVGTLAEIYQLSDKETSVLIRDIVRGMCNLRAE